MSAEAWCALLQVTCHVWTASRHPGDHCWRVPGIPKLSDSHLAQGMLGTAQRLDLSLAWQRGAGHLLHHDAVAMSGPLPRRITSVWASARINTRRKPSTPAPASDQEHCPQPLALVTSGNAHYHVQADGTCTCLDTQHRRTPGIHLLAVESHQQATGSLAPSTSAAPLPAATPPAS